MLSLKVAGASLVSCYSHYNETTVVLSTQQYSMLAMLISMSITEREKVKERRVSWTVASINKVGQLEPLSPAC